MTIEFDRMLARMRIRSHFEGLEKAAQTPTPKAQAPAAPKQQPRQGEFVPQNPQGVNSVPGSVATGGVQAQAGGGNYQPPAHQALLGSVPRPQQAFRQGPLHSSGGGSVDPLDPRNMSQGAQQAQQQSSQQISQFQGMNPQQQEQWKYLQQPGGQSMGPGEALGYMGLGAQNTTAPQQNLPQMSTGAVRPTMQTMSARSFPSQLRRYPTPPAQAAPQAPASSYRQIVPEDRARLAQQITQAAGGSGPEASQHLAALKQQFLSSGGSQLAYNLALNRRGGA